MNFDLIKKSHEKFNNFIWNENRNLFLIEKKNKIEIYRIYELVHDVPFYSFYAFLDNELALVQNDTVVYMNVQDKSILFTIKIKLMRVLMGWPSSS
jgi:hypothetical protein